MSKNFPTLGNSAIASKTPLTSQGSKEKSFFARVIDINIEPSSDGQSIFQTSGGWAYIGAIKFETLNRSSNQPGNIFPQGNVAIPLGNNIKKIPALNEIDLIHLIVELVLRQHSIFYEHAYVIPFGLEIRSVLLNIFSSRPATFFWI